MGRINRTEEKVYCKIIYVADLPADEEIVKIINIRKTFI